MFLRNGSWLSPDYTTCYADERILVLMCPSVAVPCVTWPNARQQLGQFSWSAHYVSVSTLKRSIIARQGGRTSLHVHHTAVPRTPANPIWYSYREKVNLKKTHSRVWRLIIWQKFIDVSELLTASFITVEEYTKQRININKEQGHVLPSRLFLLGLSYPMKMGLVLTLISGPLLVYSSTLKMEVLSSSDILMKNFPGLQGVISEDSTL